MPQSHTDRDAVGVLKNHKCYLGCCGSVDCALACEPKSCRLDSQSGHMPGLQARSQVGNT